MLEKRSLKAIIGMFALLLFVSIVTNGCKKKEGTATEAETSETSMSTAAPATGTGSSEAAALVNGEKILRSDLDAIVSMYSGASMGKHGGSEAQMDEERLNELRQKMLDQMIDGEILYQVSKDYPVDDLDKKAEEEFNNIVKQYGSEDKFADEAAKNNLTLDKVKANLRKNLTIQNYIDNEVIAKIEVSEEEKKKYYEENKATFQVQEQVKASHILAKVEEPATKEQKDAAMAKIKKALERVKGGEDFADVAKEVSEGPSGPRGGDLGFFGKGQMVKPFEEAAFKMKAGDVSDVVTTQFGYHIIKVYEKKSPEAKSYEDVKATIEDSVKREVFQSKMNDLISDLRAKAKIVIMN